LKIQMPSLANCCSIRPNSASSSDRLERARPATKSLPTEQRILFLTRLAEAYSQAHQDHLARQAVNQLYKQFPAARLPHSLQPYKQADHPVFMR